MKTLFYFTTLLMLSIPTITNAQNVQSDALATSGGLQAGTTTSGNTGNTFYGVKSGYSTTGSYNTLIGNETYLQGSYNWNTFIGSFSGYQTIGNYNIFLGSNSGYASEGNYNILIGNTSGNQVAGNENIFIGNGAGNESIGSRNIFIGKYSGDSSDESDKLNIGNSYTNSPLIWGDFAQKQLKFNSKVGIGFGFGNYPTTAGTADVSGYNLFVNGGILTEEVRVTLQSTWADYVFKEDYKLPSLEEVEKHIQEKGHLINVPSAEEIEQNGIALGEMAKIQQEKIEELTLYLIEQKKLNEEQKKINENQEKEIKELKSLVQSLLEKK